MTGEGGKDHNKQLPVISRESRNLEVVWYSYMRREYKFYVYIVASRTKVIYVGVTNSAERRTSEYKKGLSEGFAKKYHCNRLVYYEHYTYINDAIAREKQLKRWRREKKVWLIERDNPEWKDLSQDWFTGN